jgi:hypothetical protein
VETSNDFFDDRNWTLKEPLYEVGEKQKELENVKIIFPSVFSHNFVVQISAITQREG